MQTKAFSFSYNSYTVMALAYLYLDGAVKDIEIEHIWHKGKDLLAIYKREGQWPPYIKAWMKETLAECKQCCLDKIQQLLTDPAGIYYEYDFL